MSLSIILTLAVQASVPPVLVDEEVEELRTCTISALAFRTPTDGWMFDQCGAAFRSTDAGRSWRKAPAFEQMLAGAASGSRALITPYIQHALWLNASTGLAFSYGRSQVYRTEDAGRTWQVTALPDDEEMIYAVERAGERMWLCGSSGRVRHSLDGGRSWSEGQRLFEAARVNPSDWCSALSFLDENDGWAAGWGSLWRTADGGSTWTQLPSMLPRVLRFSDANAITGMVRLDAATAWATTRGGERLRTTDGGRTWSKVTVPEARPGVLFRPDGRPVVMLEVTRGRRFEDHVPMVDGAWVAMGASGVMSRALELYEGGHLIRRGPPVTPPSGRTTSLKGRTAADGVEWGWEGESVYRTDDEGRTWRRVGSLGSSITRLAASSRTQVLGRSGSELYQSDDGGRTWRKDSEGAGRADWSRLTGEKVFEPKPHETLDCARTGPAHVTVEFGARGCFGGTRESLVLRIAADGRATLEGAFSEWDGEARERIEHHVERKLSRAESSRWIRQLSADVTRPERPSNCQSTGTIFAKLSWTCGTSRSQVLAFETKDCDPGLAAGLVSVTRMGDVDQDAYRRAIGVRKSATMLLREGASK